ncbi:MAG: hypothetical protein HZB95_12225 [Nitrosomonadales bacterium]|nr:hypothetical protein [Nitrosomonadales bacterium]
MSRQQRSEQAVANIAERFVRAAQEYLGISPAELSKLLGYANPSTIQAVRKGATLPDFVRISEHISKLRDAHGRALNLHWVITGEGQPLANQVASSRGKRKIIDKSDDVIIMRIRRMSAGKKASLAKFLSDFG